jgi:hypothetical protein
MGCAGDVLVIVKASSRARCRRLAISSLSEVRQSLAAGSLILDSRLLVFAITRIALPVSTNRQHLFFGITLFPSRRSPVRQPIAHQSLVVQIRLNAQP